MKNKTRFGRSASGILAMWVACAGGFVPTLVAAETHALLVGVSRYPALAANLQLSGPPNDVRLMRESLIATGVPAANIRTLSSEAVAVQDAPTRQAILRSFAALATAAKSGDWVIIYLAGHGSQQPQGVPLNGYIEPDGLDEIFLPQDIGKWDGNIGRVEGAVIDDEIGIAIDAIRRRGANVWAVFDTCHAGDIAKGGVDFDRKPVTRHVSPRSLGIPPAAKQTARITADQNLSRRRSNIPAAQTKSSNTTALGSLVTFYASHPDEPAAEERLPSALAGSAPNEKRYFGLFTYLLAQAMPAGATDFKQIADRITSEYKKRPYPRPIFEGDLRQAAPFLKKRISQH